ncbi:MAG: dihydrolipoyl dehydrogenase [Eubacteriales bacterium]|nr:dihydrolipoyl dehydrogenase [Eubacteriales bacterium]
MYDVIITGGGPGGYAAAGYAAKNGMTVALVERDRLGGTCLHHGCIPTKAYLHAAETVNAAKAYAPDALQSFSRSVMLAHKNELLDTLTAGIATTMKAGKVAVFEGSGTLTNAVSPFTVAVTGKDGQTQMLEGRKVLLATGSVPARLPVKGCDSPAVWTSDDLLGEAGAEAFDSLLIVGGGVIGVEMAFLYARLGVKITLLEAEKRLLPMMDSELGRSADALLKGLGVSTITDARLQSLEQTADGFAATYEKAEKNEVVYAARALLATGRRPETSGLFAEGVAPVFNRRAIAADEFFRTSIENVYAVGDVNGQALLAHAAHAQGVAAVSHMLGVPSPMDPTLVPACVYTSPEIASVGLTQDEAKEKGIDAVIGKAPVTGNARMLIENLGRGFIKLVFDRQTRKLLGAQLLCGRATDILGELALAVENGLTADDLLRTVRPHPTFEESITAAVSAAKFN